MSRCHVLWVAKIRVLSGASRLMVITRPLVMHVNWVKISENCLAVRAHITRFKLLPLFLRGKGRGRLGRALLVILSGPNSFSDGGVAVHRQAK